MWLSALVSFLMGAVKWLFGGRQEAEGEAQGKAEQAAVDSGAVVTRDREEVKVANQVDESVSRSDDADLDRGLRKFEAGSDSGN